MNAKQRHSLATPNGLNVTVMLGNSGDLCSQLHERRQASDFETKTADKLPPAG
ncbi:MAG TPA: hypothetical protein VGG96_07975 [Steroidobacteraceae bacterium]|jgi:hypothetical protein